MCLIREDICRRRISFFVSTEEVDRPVAAWPVLPPLPRRSSTIQALCSTCRRGCMGRPLWSWRVRPLLS
jgi:hypothetical protein